MSGGWEMTTLDSTEWRAMYRVVVACRAETHETAKQMSETEEAIVERMRQLFRETGADVAAEREAMHDAMNALRAWKIAVESRTHAA